MAWLERDAMRTVAPIGAVNMAVFGSRAAMTTPEDVLAFWFPTGLDADEETHRRQFEWWFGGGADQVIVERYQPVLEAARRGELDDWADGPRGRRKGCR
jgi:uncharacterized protein (DUF924 family)